MRTIVFALFSLLAVPAFAEGTCTFTYNAYAKRIESRCQGMPGMPAAALGLKEQSMLRVGEVKSCVVRVEHVNPKKERAAKTDCK